MRISTDIRWALLLGAATSVIAAAEGGSSDPFAPSAAAASIRDSGSRNLANAADSPSGFHNVACGHPTRKSAGGCKDSKGVFHSTYRANDSESHEVRCCSEELPPFNGHVKNNGCNVFAFSKVPNVPGATTNLKCTTARSYSEAEDLCAAHGGRLCTQEEFLNGCTRSSGCGFDSHWGWTSTPACGSDEACKKEAHEDRLLGCYRDTDAARHLKIKLGSPFSLETCFESCERAGYPFYGLRNGNMCFCGNANDETRGLDNSECSKPCDIGSGACGGTSAISVYGTGLNPLPEYNHEREFIGCVKDDDGHLNKKVLDSASIKSCVETCSTDNYGIAGLKKGKECWCGNEQPLVKSSNCLLACEQGNGLCGGLSEVSLYKTINNQVPTKRLLECHGQLANFWGDPHMITYDNKKYNCQGVGHFIITQCYDYVMQGIFRAAVHSVQASITIGMVAQYKEFPKVQVLIAEEAGPHTVMMDTCLVDLYVGGQTIDTSSLPQSSDPIDIKMNKKSFEIQFPGGGPAIRTKIRMGRGCLLDVDTCLHQECIENTSAPVVGLLGSPNGDTSDDWMYPDGTVYSGTGDAFDYCTGVWCIQDSSGSLFTYPDGMGFSDYDECSGNPENPGPPDISTLPAEVVEMCDGIEGDEAMIEACKIDLVDLPAEEVLEAVEEIEENLIDIEIEEENIPLPEYLCPEDVVLYHSTDGASALADNPLHIVSRDPETGVVSLHFDSPALDDMHAVYIAYEDAAYTQQCVSNQNAASHRISLDIACPIGRATVPIHLTVSDLSLDGDDVAALSECCHAPDDDNPKIKYTFLIPCVSLCPDGDITAVGEPIRTRATGF